MVHIKKVEIFGFKSFGFKNTIVQFEPGLVSISGPNGSGKSNILDAIIFAMGENKPKVMRVDRLRSLIHDIDGNRRGPKMARSSVHFDNTDRRIPVDSDTVDITREMDERGENTYYLNKKKTNRSHILDLLDMANAGLGQLNAVQQGTVTRISEMTSDEKRVTIETMLGLAYFDEKKDAALKELNEADRRLEIANVRMDGIKKQIDELEEERNQKLRYDTIRKELERYRAIDAAGKLKTTLDQKSEKELLLHSISDKITKLTEEKIAVHTQIIEIEAKKSELMADAAERTRSKSTIDRELSNAIEEHESEKAAMSASQKNVEQIKTRLSEIGVELQNIDDLRAEISPQIIAAKESLTTIDTRKNKITEDLKLVDMQRQKVLDEQSSAASKKSEIDQKIQQLFDQQNAAKTKLGEIQNEKKSNEDKIHINTNKLEEIKHNTGEMETIKHRLNTIIQSHKDTISELKTRREKLDARKSNIESELEESGSLLEKTNNAANKYEAKIKTVKGFMHEDYTVAKLKEDAESLGILGLVYEMISWDKKYERAILAASSYWLKAVVVNDFTALLSVAEFARSKNLSKLKMIPLEAIPEFKLDMPKISGALSVLSDHIQCDAQYLRLKTFLFGNIVIADSKESAHNIAGMGYKSVTLDGEFFEASGGTVTIDINSKISKLTKLISMSTHIDGLFASINSLKKYVKTKKYALVELETKIQANTDRLVVSEKHLIAANEQQSNLETKILSSHHRKKHLEYRITDITKKLSLLDTSIAKEQSHTESITERIGIVRENYAEGELVRIARELKVANTNKANAERMHTEIMQEHIKATTTLAELETTDKRYSSRENDLDAEKRSKMQEKDELEVKIQEHRKALQIKNEILIELRQKEQESISSGSSSMEHINDCDGKLKELNGEEKRLTSDTSSMTRQSDSLKRDLQDIAVSEVKLRQTLTTAGLSKDTETFDVSPIVDELEAELKTLNELNAKAPDNYLEVIKGYRLWSPRKNALENERNSIVEFIEKVERDKRQSFLDAFDKVDKEIRTIFNNMTGGNAWLELQNEDDIFNSGISYLLQFPNKPKRESTSISGGEKTLAATVFVLALQRLKPSPFYLFDEIDAHLDAPNSERLAKILSERAKESQFIMVSLKDALVQKAKLVYGVYPKNGVSNIVTYKDQKHTIKAS